MSLRMAGIDHTLAPLDIRGVFSFTKSQMEELYSLTKEQPEIDGCVILSTCNRTEIWLNISNSSVWDPVEFLCGYIGENSDKYEKYFVRREGLDAVEYLFRLAAGLKSKIIGEDQIITQVGDALAFARNIEAADSILEVLFRQAVTAAKRAKTEAFISLADRSVIHTALDLLKKNGIQVSGKNCLVIGNGMMGRLAAQALNDQGGKVRVTVRKYLHKTVEVPVGCIPMDYADRYEQIKDCDIIVSATSSPHYTLEADVVAGINLTKPLIIIDLAVPRDIPPQIADIQGITLYDIDSFEINLQSDKFKNNIQKIENIIDEEKDNFLEWYSGRNFVPIIRQINETAGNDAMARMTPYIKHIPLEQDEKIILKKEIAGASGRMMNHILFSLRTSMDEETFRNLLADMQRILSEKKH